jgi:hypothetical protein
MASIVLVEQFFNEVIRIYGSDEGDEDSLAVNNNKLDAIGFATGHRLIGRLTFNRKLMKTELDVVKYLCKDFWLAVFSRKIDKLQTNNKGVYVLHDNNFLFLRKLSTSIGSETDQALKYLSLPCGILRGALSNLGIESEISANVRKIPHCEFVIKILKYEDDNNDSSNNLSDVNNSSSTTA